MEVISFLIFILCQLFTVTILLRAIFSWFPLRPSNPVASILYEITEPILSPLRRVIPSMGAFDITPLVAIIILQLISSLLP
jgi:YggT family protein